MTGRATLTIILLVCGAHAMVHAYELSLPSVEQQIAAEYYGSDQDAGKRMTGWLSNTWRLMWGLGAIFAGWFVDRLGSRPMLIFYLVGCSGACGLAAMADSREWLFGSMILMGMLASIYHPAGLALISHETSVEERARALGLHGIFGSLGIGLTPLVVGLLFSQSLSWRQVYLVLAVPGVLLACFFAWQLRSPDTDEQQRRRAGNAQTGAHWIAFFVLTLLASCQGFIYSALMSFLPRYLSGGGGAWSLDLSRSNYAASGVLLLGCIGQAVAGRWARPGKIEWQLMLVTLTNAPLLAWMAVAEGWARPASAGLLATVHFMHQPLYNSLIADYSPSRRRSLAYGFSFAMGLGLGSFGAGFAGSSRSDLMVYGSLAGVALVGTAIAFVLVQLRKAAVFTQTL